MNNEQCEVISLSLEVSRPPPPHAQFESSAGGQCWASWPWALESWPLWSLWCIWVARLGGEHGSAGRSAAASQRASCSCCCIEPTSRWKWRQALTCMSKPYQLIAKCERDQRVGLKASGSAELQPSVPEATLSAPAVSTYSAAHCAWWLKDFSNKIHCFSTSI